MQLSAVYVGHIVKGYDGTFLDTQVARAKRTYRIEVRKLLQENLLVIIIHIDPLSWTFIPLFLELFVLSMTFVLYCPVQPQLKKHFLLHHCFVLVDPKI